MSTAIAYLANSFPEAVEPYVWEEICELRRHGQRVVPCSVKRPAKPSDPDAARETLYVFPIGLRLAIETMMNCVRCFPELKEFLSRIVTGPEPMSKRFRAFAHTWLGVYLAAILRSHSVKHIHVHHGYFSSWVGMVAAKILGASFSMTLHGSDLMCRADYMDIKLRSCNLCVTISEFNQRHIVEHYPEIESAKILVQRLGIDTSFWLPQPSPREHDVKTILSVGRLHPVKCHQCLVRACHALKCQGVKVHCLIAGEGPERKSLLKMIADLDLQREVKLLGHVARERLPELYARADVVVLTSKSEGIPVTLMEAMAMEKVVIAPAITGIPELITQGETGFLYQPGSLYGLVHTMQFVVDDEGALEGLRRAARRQVQLKFNRSTNLKTFAVQFLERMGRSTEYKSATTASEANEDSLLQQIQLPV